MKFLMLFLFVVLTGSASPADFFDDFESYDIGDDPADSDNWDSFDEGGRFLVAELLGSKVIESHFNPPHNSLGQVVERETDISDLSIDVDSRYYGNECNLWLGARYTGEPPCEFYIGLIHISDPTTPTIVKILYRDRNYTMV
ncbi:MAG: hypothetical protein GY771_09790, partial [bacterium]|nr:hypothetical protein [bacterium]